MLGCAALWVDTVKIFGALKIADVLEPAIQLAEGGFVLLALHFALASFWFNPRAPVSELHSTFVSWPVFSRDRCVDVVTLVAKIRRVH